MDIQQSMEGFCPLRELCETAVFESFREGVEQAPDTPIFKDRVSWFPPFLQDRGDETVAADPNISGPNDQVVSSGVFDVGFLVGSDAFVLVMPFRHELTDGSLSDPGEVSDDEPGVLSGEFDLPREGKVVADKNRSAGDNTCRKGLVMAVSET